MTFKERVETIKSGTLRALRMEILQVNVGYRCNMTCKHCHVQAGPGREEIMDKGNIDAVITTLSENGFKSIDITGGAPELNPLFRYLVKKAKDAGRHVTVRTNLTIIPGGGIQKRTFSKVRYLV